MRKKNRQGDALDQLIDHPETAPDDPFARLVAHLATALPEVEPDAPTRNLHMMSILEHVRAAETASRTPRHAPFWRPVVVAARFAGAAVLLLGLLVAGAYAHLLPADVETVVAKVASAFGLDIPESKRSEEPRPRPDGTDDDDEPTPDGDDRTPAAEEEEPAGSGRGGGEPEDRDDDSSPAGGEDDREGSEDRGDDGEPQGSGGDGDSGSGGDESDDAEPKDPDDGSDPDNSSGSGEDPDEDPEPEDPEGADPGSEDPDEDPDEDPEEDPEGA